MTDTKKCTKCGVEKDLSFFNNNRRTKDGKSYMCKECHNKYNHGRVYQRKEQNARYASLCADAKRLQALGDTDICAFIQLKVTTRKEQIVKSMRNSTPARKAFFDALETSNAV